MSAKVTWSGLAELRAALRNLPAALTADASTIVSKAAADAEAEIRAGYASHRRTGNLADHVVVKTLGAGAFGISIQIKNTARHAWLFDAGTQVRHTAIGANRGSMPPGRVFVPAVIRHRRAMYAELKAMLVAHGLSVSGDP